MPSRDASLAPDRLADQVELVLLPMGTRITRAKAEQVLRKLQPELADAQIERNVDSAFLALRERERLVGPLYPLEAGERAFTSRATIETAQVAEFLALLSAYPVTRRRSEGHKPDAHFEEITAAAISNYVGGPAYVYNQLMPGRGMRVKLAELGRLLGVESYPNRTRPERFDNGLDVVGWRKFPGRATVFPIVLVQCTVGASDPIAKARETSERDWSDLLDIPAAAIITAYAIPHVLPLDWRRWRDLRNATELALDRVRILHLLTEADCERLASQRFVDCLEYMRSLVPSELRAPRTATRGQGR